MDGMTDAMEFTCHTAEDGTTTWSVDRFDDETTANLEFLCIADGVNLVVDWIGVRVTILDTPYRITAVDYDMRTVSLTREQS